MLVVCDHIINTWPREVLSLYSEAVNHGQAEEGSGQLWK